jgi:hypothetical protein
MSGLVYASPSTANEATAPCRESTARSHPDRFRFFCARPEYCHHTCSGFGIGAASGFGVMTSRRHTLLLHARSEPCSCSHADPSASMRHLRAAHLRSLGGPEPEEEERTFEDHEAIPKAVCASVKR